ncbi:tripartite tricarboxylate transporter substrate binding protein [Variovorax paradoxus]|nr:tripartite tricarboxylate transporter substrate binding protein [Variovorax paradoxus]MBT2305452.1 tripartite tricarboxylate transporter substrate binding protein [Variovorax paradoxus]
MITRRTFVRAAALATAPAAGVLHAQQFPARAIRLIVPTAPGQTLDIVARHFSESLGRRMGVPMIVENRPGAGVSIGTDYVAKAPADGYSVLFGSMPHYVTPYVADFSANYDPVKDFTPIAMLAKTSMGIVVAAQSPHRTLADLVRAMKAQPGEVTFASGGNVTAAHLCMSLLNSRTQTTAKHVSYKNSTNGVMDVASGLVDFSCQGSGAILPYIRSGKLRLLAVTGQRWDLMPNVPTAVEAGFAGVELNGWVGVLARAGTPLAIIQRLSDEFVRAGQQPEFKALCDAQQLTMDVFDHRKFAAQVPTYAATFKRLALLSQGKS